MGAVIVSVILMAINNEVVEIGIALENFPRDVGRYLDLRRIIRLTKGEPRNRSRISRLQRNSSILPRTKKTAATALPSRNHFAISMSLVFVNKV